MDYDRSLQEQFGTDFICFGCGPANTNGLQLKSYVKGDLIVAQFTPKLDHQAFPGVLNGGIIGTILDCHCNWAAYYFYRQQTKLEQSFVTVTSEYLN